MTRTVGETQSAMRASCSDAAAAAAANDRPGGSDAHAGPPSSSGRWDKPLRHARAYALSNGLPLAVGTACWAWLEGAGVLGGDAGQPWGLRALLHIAACQAFHLAAMVGIAVAFSRGRARDAPAAHWTDVRSPHGLYVADLLSSCLALHVYTRVPSRRLPAFAASALPSFFLYRLLLMELVFDLLHYAMHRLLHAVPALYGAIHKIHHSHHADLHVLSTLQMHPVDGVLTNTLPLAAVVALAPAASLWEFHAYMAYKTAQELFGHCGVHLKVKSFPSNPWLVEALRMDLYIIDHTAHHIDGRYNFGKRLSFWDRVFGTFRSMRPAAAAAAAKHA